MKLKEEEEIFKEFTRRTAVMGTKTAIYLIYQMGFLEGSAPITGIKQECNCKNGTPQTSGGCKVHGVKY